jgi:pyrimidine operon attenuation protein / uracil phosphoribosyltransferase
LPRLAELRHFQIMTNFVDASAISAAIGSIVRSVAEKHPTAEDLVVIGVANGGIEFARRLAAQLNDHYRASVPCGQVNAQFHRDDVEYKPIPKSFLGTEIPFDIDGKRVLLADDVLFSGRTIRAALNELFDYGRPEAVELAVLVDRGGRRLPVAPDYVGLHLSVGPEEKVHVALSAGNPEEDTIQIETV